MYAAKLWFYVLYSIPYIHTYLYMYVYTCFIYSSMFTVQLFKPMKNCRSFSNWWFFTSHNLSVRVRFIFIIFHFKIRLSHMIFFYLSLNISLYNTLYIFFNDIISKNFHVYIIYNELLISLIQSSPPCLVTK